MALEFEKPHVGDRLRTRDLLVRVVEDTPDYYAGRLEALGQKVEKLTCLLARAVALMSEDQQRALVECEAHGWEEVK